VRRTWVLVICIAVAVGSMSLGVSSEEAGGESSAQRNVLFELFTATWCGGCPYADAAADQLKAEYGERVPVLQYHIQEKGVSEPYFDTPETNERSAEYSVPNLPFLWVDGIESTEGASSTSEAYSRYKSILDTRLTVDPSLGLSITNATLESGKIVVTVELTATDSLQHDSFDLRFVAYENELADDTTIYNYVVRDMDVQSVSASSLPATLSLDLIYNATWNYSNMGAVVFAQVGDAGDVLQSHSMSFGVEDEDGDGLPDEWEMLKLGTLLYSGEDDPDGDGITNLEEYQNHTDPLVKDSEADQSVYIWVAFAAVVIILLVTFIVTRMMGRTRERPKRTRKAEGEKERKSEETAVDEDDRES
jgi:thiol-disulfide isomerase/thioredoxin